MTRYINDAVVTWEHGTGPGMRHEYEGNVSAA